MPAHCLREVVTALWGIALRVASVASIEEGAAGAGAGGEGAAVVDVGAELHEGGKRRL